MFILLFSLITASEEMKQLIQSFLIDFQNIFLSFKYFNFRILQSRSLIQILIYNLTMRKQEQSAQQKQQFLRAQILQAGIDAQQFMQFMGSYKNQGVNIDLDKWNMQQLRDVVNEFKQLIKAEQYRQSMIPNASTSTLTQKLVTDTIMSTISNKNKKQKVYYYPNNQNVWDYKIFTEHQCKQMGIKFPNLPQCPLIIAENHQIKTSQGIIFGIGATSQLYIKLYTNFTKHKVVRKSEDFEWLRSILIKKFQGCYIPALEIPRSIVPEDQQSISKTIKGCIRFINKLVQFDYVRNSRIFQQFIDQKDITHFTAFKNKYKQIEAIPDISKIQTVNGKFTAEISDRILKLRKCANIYSKACQENYANIENIISKILYDLQNLSKHVISLSKQMISMTENYLIMSKEADLQQTQMKSYLKTLNTIFTTTSNSLKNQTQVLKHFLQKVIKNVNLDWKQFCLFSKQKQYELNQYIYFRQALLKKKQKYLYDSSKWQMTAKQQQELKKVDLKSLPKQQIYNFMFPKQTSKQSQMRVWQAYQNTMFQNSFLTLLKFHQKYQISQFAKFAQRLAQNSKQTQNMFTSFSKMFESCQKQL